MTSNPEFSIIVPVYNVEPYLENCLKSILNQTLKNIEVILVYDSSTTDNSLNICQHFSEKHSNFNLYFGKSKGVGASRNYGLGKAKGQFICFVDSDDWIEPDLCSDMHKVLNETNADFVNFGFDFIKNNNKTLVIKKNFNIKNLQGDNIFRKAMLDDDIYTVVWNKVFRRSFLLENQIIFPELVWEDVIFSRKVAYFSQNTSFVSRVYYHALVRNGSNSRSISAIYLSDGLSVLDLEHQFILLTPDGRKFETLFRAHFIKHISFFLIKAAFQNQSWHEYLKCFELIGNSDYNNYRKEIEVLSLLPTKNRLLIFGCKFPRILRVIASMLKIFDISPY